MLDIKFDAFPVLKTNRLVLRQILDSDAEPLFHFRSDPRVMQYFGRPLMQEIAEAEKLVSDIHAMFDRNDGVQWAICLLDDPAMIGTITIWKIDKAHHRAEIGYLLSPDWQGKGLMTEALQAMLAYAFGTLHLHSLEANVNPDNAASITLLERNGFVREAYFRENFYFEGKFEDSAIYSLIRPAGSVDIKNT